jgi:hypothetical protein
MATVTSATGLNADLATLLRGGKASRGAEAAASMSAAKSPDPQAGDAPATIIALSDRAKAIMARAKEEQTVADRLDRMLARTGDGEDADTSSDTSLTLDDVVGTSAAAGSSAGDLGSDILETYGDLPQAAQWAANARADNVGLLEAGTNGFDVRLMEGLVRTMKAGGEVRLGGETMSEDQQFVQSVQLRLADEIVSLDDAGLTDMAQALRAAIGSGAIKVQRSTDVPELNLNYTVTHFADAGGGGTSGSWVWNPTGDAKAALDNRRATAIGGVDRGAFFLSW